MGRQKKTEEEKQQFIDVNFESYQKAVNPNLEEWAKLDNDTRQKRIKDWICRKRKKEEVKVEREKLYNYNKAKDAIIDALREVVKYDELKKLANEIPSLIENQMTFRREVETKKLNEKIQELNNEYKEKMKVIEDRLKALND